MIALKVQNMVFTIWCFIVSLLYQQQKNCPVLWWVAKWHVYNIFSNTKSNQWFDESLTVVNCIRYFIIKLQHTLNYNFRMLYTPFPWKFQTIYMYIHTTFSRGYVKVAERRHYRSRDTSAITTVKPWASSR